uniref:Uncharacterized protein n=1 Tax=Anguilla anguilla TaxID=7936 RepID=A0A0E9TT29_ANGAN
MCITTIAQFSLSYTVTSLLQL